MIVKRAKTMLPASLIAALAVSLSVAGYVAAEERTDEQMIDEWNETFGSYVNASEGGIMPSDEIKVSVMRGIYEAMNSTDDPSAYGSSYEGEQREVLRVVRALHGLIESTNDTAVKASLNQTLWDLRHRMAQVGIFMPGDSDDAELDSIHGQYQRERRDYFDLLERSPMQPPQPDYPPPLRQIRDGGVSPEDVQCNTGLVHAVRPNGAHACVRDSTAERMDWEIFAVEAAPPDRVSYATILIAGIEESVPSTEGKNFRILVEPDIVVGVDFVPEEGLSFTLIPNAEEESLLVKIPKNFPILTTRPDTAMIYDDRFVIGDGVELPSELTEDDCFLNYAISVQNSTSIDLVYTFPAVYEPRVVSRTVDDSCLERVFANP